MAIVKYGLFQSNMSILHFYPYFNDSYWGQIAS